MSAAPPSIRLLDPVVANQIAAGEVVTRPASVVKELLENALDAGATRLHVEIESGGMKRIVVVDDGHGMRRDDAVLALQRHATSKIRRADDLHRIATLGFRGEALPSIASVSHLTLRTRVASEETGTELHVAGGQASAPVPTGCAAGTAVEVEDLFFNVPARRKFLRAVSTESAHVTEAVLAAALAHPTTNIILTRDGRRVRRWLGTNDRSERVAQVLRTEIWTHGAGRRGPVSVEALFGPPERARTGAAGLRLFVNDRHVSDRALARAVALAFGPALDRGRYPIGAVFLTLAPELVDVNVHPQKAEVRFAHARAVTDALYAVVAGELERALGLSGNAPTTTSATATWPSHRAGRPPQGAQQLPEPAWQWRDPGGAQQLPSASPEPATLGESRGRAATAPARDGPPRPRPLAPAEATYIGLVRQRFLLYEADDALVVVDREAAQRYLVRHRLRYALLNERRLASQRLLFPWVQEVGATTRDHALGAAAELHELGFELRAAGPDRVALHSVAEPLGQTSPEALLGELLSCLDRWRGTLSKERSFELLTRLSHHAVVPGEPAPSAERALATLQELELAARETPDETGRAPWRRLAWRELESGGGGR